jgi:hypothetical protein
MIVLAFPVGVWKIVLGLAFPLAACLLIKHLIEIDSLVDQGLNIFSTSHDDDRLLYFVV